MMNNDEQYRDLIESMRDLVFTVDLKGMFTYINPIFAMVTGYAVADLIGRPFTDVIAPESRKIVAIQFKRGIKSRKGALYEVDITHKDGGRIPVEFNVTTLLDESNQPAGRYGIGRDITERRQTEEALRESQELGKSILLSVPHGLFGVEQRRIFFANDAMEDVFGWKPEELIGKSTRMIFRTDQEWEEYGAILYSRLKIQPAWAFEWDTPFVRKDGKEIFCRMSVSRTGQGLGESRRIVATFEDITDRRRAEEALRESERRLTDIIEFLPDATLVIDREGKVIAWNRAMEAMTGVGKEAMIGKGNYEYALPLYGDRRPILIDLALHPDEKIESQYTALQRTGDILFGEAYTPRLSPGNIHLSGSASVLRNSRGEIIGAIQCMRNNTERKNLDERLAQARKMEALGLLAGGVAHDLNNVLGVLVGYSELMLHDMDKDSRFRKHAESILTAGERAATIVQDMLALARRGVHTAEVVDFNRAVQDYLHGPEYESICAVHANSRIKTELEDPLLRIKGSPAHLGKVLANLVLNAAEAMPKGGEVIIRTRNRYLDRPVRGYADVKAGDYVVLSVADSGQGIHDEDMRQIFEPFYTKKVMGRSGTGLGLAVVWGTVKDHDGYIDVESRLGEGTIFSLFFPVTREDLREDAPAPVAAFRGRGETILVVDDVKEQRELATWMLGRLDYRVTSVSSGEEAVDYLKTNRPDLVVLDMIMDPGMDGLDTYREMIAMHPRQKAIIVSGYAETDQVREAQKLGAGAYVRKPYILERLGMAVRRELDSPGRNSA
jgi:two-component system cell cycle sensor histidine kinase/response regulator CckA